MHDTNIELDDLLHSLGYTPLQTSIHKKGIHLKGHLLGIKWLQSEGFWENTCVLQFATT